MSLSTILMILLAISEILAMIPGFAENSIFQVVVRVLKWLIGFVGESVNKVLGKDKEEKSDDKEA